MERFDNGSPGFYRIQVEGLLQEHWSDWFNGDLAAAIQREPEKNRTVIVLNVPDQAALRGIVNRIWDLNLSIISVERQ